MENLVAYKGRQLDENKKVEVYFHFRKKMFSVKQGAYVIGHTKEVLLQDVTTEVNEEKRLRVIAEQVKNVHAKVRGYVVEFPANMSTEGFDPMYYNPYKVNYFKDSQGRDVRKAHQVLMQGTQGYWR